MGGVLLSWKDYILLIGWGCAVGSIITIIILGTIIGDKNFYYPYIIPAMILFCLLSAVIFARQLLMFIKKVDSYIELSKGDIELLTKKMEEEQEYIKRIAELEKQLEEANRRADEAQEKVAEVQQSSLPSFAIPPAEKASLVRSEKALAAWKEVIPAMMQAYHHCMVEGEKPRQKQDFYAIFNELDTALTDTQYNFFRSCLPEGHVDREGGKPGKI